MGIGGGSSTSGVGPVGVPLTFAFPYRVFYAGGVRSEMEQRQQAAQRARRYRARQGARTGQRGPRPSAVCGTRSGYNRHYREGTPVCESCRLAQRAWEREVRARRRLGND